MKITTGWTRREQALIGGLVRDIMARTPAANLRVFCAEDAGRVIAAVAFTRLAFPEDPHRVMLLSPMAVATDRQRQGIGQVLIRQALDSIRAEGVESAVTCGAPADYRRVGFAPVTEDEVRAPLPLSLPQGWLAQSLTGGGMPVLRGPSVCVAALNRADIR